MTIAASAPLDPVADEIRRLHLSIAELEREDADVERSLAALRERTPEDHETVQVARARLDQLRNRRLFLRELLRAVQLIRPGGFIQLVLESGGPPTVYAKTCQELVDVAKHGSAAEVRAARVQVWVKVAMWSLFPLLLATSQALILGRWLLVPAYLWAWYVPTLVALRTTGRAREVWFWLQSACCLVFMGFALGGWIAPIVGAGYGVVRFGLTIGRTASLERLPGSQLRSVFEFLYHERTRSRVFDPIIADMQEEYVQALAQGRVHKAKWVRLRGYLALAHAAGLHRLLALWDVLSKLT